MKRLPILFVLLAAACTTTPPDPPTAAFYATLNPRLADLETYYASGIAPDGHKMSDAERELYALQIQALRDYEAEATKPAASN